jgi:hypoxanthine phosphoribosyltransferase
MAAEPGQVLGPPVIDREAIAERVTELAQAIDEGGGPLVLVASLHGASVFAADLSRALRTAHVLDFVAVSRFRPGAAGARLVKDLDHPVTGTRVVLVWDVVDTGLSLRFVLDRLQERGPRSLEVCTLLDRPHRRLGRDLPIRHAGFEVPDELFVGYGLDPRGRWRGLPDIHALPAG